MFGEGKLLLLIDTLHNAGCETVCVTTLCGVSKFQAA
jgi:hypothetical protein